MESEIETTDFDKKGRIEKIKDWSYENWQTILVILIVLIVGMSAYNYNQQNNPSNENQSSVTIIDDNESENANENEFNEENDIAQEENNEEISEADVENQDQIEAAEEDNEKEVAEVDEVDEVDEVNEVNEEKTENNSVISSSDDSGKIYTVSANYGEGITHLARRALNEYLQETGEELELTKEQEIYAEDYLQNKTGSESIEVNHQETFSESLIKEAISSAEQLTPKSLDNLKKYIK